MSVNVTLEKPLTVYLNSLELVTNMTIGDYPDLLALGFYLTKDIKIRRS